MADNENEDAAVCDTCKVGTATMWCDDCSALFCKGKRCSDTHKDHVVGELNGEAEIEGEVAEDEAYQLHERFESNAHKLCRRLFKPIPPCSPSSLLSAEQWLHFSQKSFVILKDFFPLPVALQAHEYTLQLKQEGLLTEFKNEKDIGRDSSARSDLRLFLTPDSPYVQGTPLSPLVKLLMDLKDELARGIELTGEQHEVQLGYYGTHGEHYLKHRDGFPNDGSKHLTQQPGRRVTVTMYMNEWDEKDGGCLRLYPPIEGTDEYDILDVPPTAGTCALFLSGAMDHEVLPSFAERVAIATWYS